MEIWLKQDEKAIQIPILPPSFNVSVENGHQTVNVQTKGNVTILGKKGLKTIEFSSFFPDRTYPFAAYPKPYGPYGYVRKIEAWCEEPIQLTITDTNINFLVIVKSFTYGEPDITGDIEYTLSMEEYNPPKYTKPKKTTTTTTKKPATTTKKPTTTTKKKQKTYTVKSGDNLWDLAYKFYGSGSKMSKLYSANKSVIESTAKKRGLTSSSHNGVAGWWIFPGTKLVIPS